MTAVLRVPATKSSCLFKEERRRRLPAPLTLSAKFRPLGAAIAKHLDNGAKPSSVLPTENKNCRYHEERRAPGGRLTQVLSVLLILLVAQIARIGRIPVPRYTPGIRAKLGKAVDLDDDWQGNAIWGSCRIAQSGNNFPRPPQRVLHFAPTTRESRRTESLSPLPRTRLAALTTG